MKKLILILFVPCILFLGFSPTTVGASWQKVKDLSVGQYIKTVDGWEKITGIELLPPEQVYDISISGTHNFLGNGIVAHNTSLERVSVPRSGEGSILFPGVKEVEVKVNDTGGIVLNKTSDFQGQLVKVFDGRTGKVVNEPLQFEFDSELLWGGDRVNFAGKTWEVVRLDNEPLMNAGYGNAVVELRQVNTVAGGAGGNVVAPVMPRAVSQPLAPTMVSAVPEGGYKLNVDATFRAGDGNEVRLGDVKIVQVSDRGNKVNFSTQRPVGDGSIPAAADGYHWEIRHANTTGAMDKIPFSNLPAGSLLSSEAGQGLGLGAIINDLRNPISNSDKQIGLHFANDARANGTVGRLNNDAVIELTNIANPRGELPTLTKVVLANGEVVKVAQVADSVRVRVGDVDVDVAVIGLVDSPVAQRFNGISEVWKSTLTSPTGTQESPIFSVFSRLGFRPGEVDQAVSIGDVAAALTRRRPENLATQVGVGPPVEKLKFLVRDGTADKFVEAARNQVDIAGQSILGVEGRVIGVVANNADATAKNLVKAAGGSPLEAVARIETETVRTVVRQGVIDETALVKQVAENGADVYWTPIAGGSEQIKRVRSLAGIQDVGGNLSFEDGSGTIRTIQLANGGDKPVSIFEARQLINDNEAYLGKIYDEQLAAIRANNTIPRPVREKIVQNLQEPRDEWTNKAVNASLDPIGTQRQNGFDVFYSEGKWHVETNTETPRPLSTQGIEIDNNPENTAVVIRNTDLDTVNGKTITLDFLKVREPIMLRPGKEAVIPPDALDIKITFGGKGSESFILTRHYDQTFQLGSRNNPIPEIPLAWEGGELPGRPSRINIFANNEKRVFDDGQKISADWLNQFRKENHGNKGMAFSDFASECPDCWVIIDGQQVKKPSAIAAADVDSITGFLPQNTVIITNGNAKFSVVNLGDQISGQDLAGRQNTWAGILPVINERITLIEKRLEIDSLVEDNLRILADGGVVSEWPSTFAANEDARFIVGNILEDLRDVNNNLIFPVDLPNRNHIIDGLVADFLQGKILVYGQDGRFFMKILNQEYWDLVSSLRVDLQTMAKVFSDSDFSRLEETNLLTGLTDKEKQILSNKRNFFDRLWADPRSGEPQTSRETVLAKLPVQPEGLKRTSPNHLAVDLNSTLAGAHLKAQTDIVNDLIELNRVEQLDNPNKTVGFVSNGFLEKPPPVKDPITGAVIGERPIKAEWRGNPRAKLLLIDGDHYDTFPGGAVSNYDKLQNKTLAFVGNDPIPFGDVLELLVKPKNLTDTRVPADISILYYPGKMPPVNSPIPKLIVDIKDIPDAETMKNLIRLGYQKQDRTFLENYFRTYIKAKEQEYIARNGVSQAIKDAGIDIWSGPIKDPTGKSLNTRSGYKVLVDKKTTGVRNLTMQVNSNTLSFVQDIRDGGLVFGRNKDVVLVPRIDPLKDNWFFRQGKRAVAIPKALGDVVYEFERAYVDLTVARPIQIIREKVTWTGKTVDKDAKPVGPAGKVVAGAWLLLGAAAGIYNHPANLNFIPVPPFNLIPSNFSAKGQLFSGRTVDNKGQERFTEPIGQLTADYYLSSCEEQRAKYFSGGLWLNKESQTILLWSLPPLGFGLGSFVYPNPDDPIPCEDVIRSPGETGNKNQPSPQPAKPNINYGSTPTPTR